MFALPEPTAGDYLRAGRRTVDSMKWLLALAMAPGLTGCGRTSSAVLSSTAVAVSADGQRSSTSPPAGGSVAPAAPAAPAAAEATSLCAFLQSEQPRLTAAGSTAGAVATFAIDLANWVEQ